MGVEALTSTLERAGVRYELLPHAHAETALAEAAALGVEPAEVAKTLIVKTPSGNVRAVLPGSERLDVKKVAELLGETRKSVQLASEDDLVAGYPEFELGAVPPLGGAHQDPVIVDSRLTEQESIVLEAGSHDESIRLATGDLLRLTEARIADICVD
jgi:Ala-tRNA(Pro) deacylase